MNVGRNDVTPVPAIDIFEGASPAYRRWLERNVHAHRVSGYRSVTLSLKRVPHMFTDVLIIGGGVAGARAALAIDVTGQ